MAIFRGSGSSLTGSAIDPTEALLDSDFTVNGILVRTGSGVYSTTPDNSANWDTAYSWGDWSVGVDKPFVDGLNVDADTLDSQEGSWYQDRTNHTGTQTLSTISDSGTAASADLTTSATDTTAGRAMATGLGGLGVSTPSTVSDFDALTTPGFYRTASSSQPEMPAAAHFKVFVFNYSSNGITQIAATAAGSSLYIRHKAVATGTWGSWSQIYDHTNILGTVSQSSGVPTGAIIEQGSNSNGEYRILADGSVDMWGYKDVTLSTSSAAFSETFTLPTSIDVSVGDSVGFASPETDIADWGDTNDRYSLWSVRGISDTGFQIAGFRLSPGTNWSGTSGRVFWEVRGRKF